MRAEQFRCEVRDAGELEIFRLGEGVADLDGAVFVQTRMSPAQASTACSRSPAAKVTASEMFTSLPMRTWRVFMPLL